MSSSRINALLNAFENGPCIQIIFFILKPAFLHSSSDSSDGSTRANALSATTENFAISFEPVVISMFPVVFFKVFCGCFDIFKNTSRQPERPHAQPLYTSLYTLFYVFCHKFGVRVSCVNDQSNTVSSKNQPFLPPSFFRCARFSYQSNSAPYSVATHTCN